ncbi:MAG: Asp-tRNA(Asn)/Glu-tRNA(Gln) amidotransferase subunit GatC [Gemmatimonadaceae bacterium]|nr:Asp-tRNA(Asn)/Glu-tRNA(Gln) amidotransferase subunit GatC [Gemmatimonadaceae bacterium]
MAVTIDDVRHVAALARLGLTDDRATALVGELNGILGHMAALEAVDTTGLAEVIGVGATGTPLREDRGGRSDALAVAPHAFAPEMRDGLLIVPRLATHESTEEA